jgi:hypothetical protein
MRVTGEMDIYKANSEALVIMSGAEVGTPLPATYNGIPVEEWPRVVLSPAFAPCLAAIKVSGRHPTTEHGCPVHSKVHWLQLPWCARAGSLTYASF